MPTAMKMNMPAAPNGRSTSGMRLKTTTSSMREHGFGRQGVEARHQIGKHFAPFLGDRDDSPGEPKGFISTLCLRAPG